MCAEYKWKKNQSFWFDTLQVTERNYVLMKHWEFVNQWKWELSHSAWGKVKFVYIHRQRNSNWPLINPSVLCTGCWEHHCWSSACQRQGLGFLSVVFLAFLRKSRVDISIKYGEQVLNIILLSPESWSWDSRKLYLKWSEEGEDEDSRQQDIYRTHSSISFLRVIANAGQKIVIFF